MDYSFHPQARYTNTHEWVRMEGDIAIVGISDYAQHLLSDVVYVELPSEGDTVTTGQALGTVESVKASEDANSPITGEVVAVNTALEANPEWVNEDPYGKAWLVKVKPSDPDELAGLMDASAYESFVRQEEEKGEH